jgi:hypothetical protein
MLATLILAVAWVIRMWLWVLAINWKAVPTYTSFVFLGPFSLLLIWSAYRGRNWARWLLLVLHIPTVLTWSSAMVNRPYARVEVAFMSLLLGVQAIGALLLFLPPSVGRFYRQNVTANNGAAVDGGMAPQPQSDATGPPPLSWFVRRKDWSMNVRWVFWVHAEDFREGRVQVLSLQ